MKKQLRQTILTIPNSTGIYKFLDSTGSILYIGKAKRLRSRITSYFTSNHFDRPRIISLIPLIEKVEYIQTDNEIEALILESALVKKYMPKFNSDLKDDKSYAWLYINHKDRYPTVKIVRTRDSKTYKKGKLFGPYPSGRSIKRVFSYLRRIYPFCTAKDPTKPCFYSKIGLCPGPDATQDEYMKNIKGIISFLNGSNRSHIVELEKQMINYSNNHEFEKAAVLRDRINDLKYLGSKIGYTYFDSEADYIDSQKKKAKAQIDRLSKELLVYKIRRIECFDISNTQGKLAYGSMVVSIDGQLKNSHYRVFKIKELDTPNDPQMVLEVINRRLKHIDLPEEESLKEQPEIILIDGGKTQLTAIYDGLRKDWFDKLTFIGITKGRKYKRKGSKLLDEYWKLSPNGKIEQLVGLKSNHLSLLRDEAHRFALLHHRKARKLNQKKSVLDTIEGVGDKRRKALIKNFGSVENIKSKSVDDVNKVVRNRKLSERIIKALMK